MTSGHMVQNLLRWMANGAVGHQKTMNGCHLFCPTASLATQPSGFCTMLPSHAKGQLQEKYRRICKLHVYNLAKEGGGGG